MLRLSSITRHIAHRDVEAGIRTRAITLDLGQLINTKCNCSANTQLLNEGQVQSIGKLLPLWTVQEGEPKSIRRALKAKNFVAAMQFLNRVAEIAEADNHHPDLSLRNYRDVEVTLSTHDVGGLSLNDLILAAKIDQLHVEYSSKWLDSQPPETREVMEQSKKR